MTGGDRKNPQKAAKLHKGANPKTCTQLQLPITFMFKLMNLK